MDFSAAFFHFIRHIYYTDNFQYTVHIGKQRILEYFIVYRISCNRNEKKIVKINSDGFIIGSNY